MAQLQTTSITGTGSISGFALVGAKAQQTAGAGEGLVVNTSGSSTINLATIEGALNNYTQLNVINVMTANTASVDIVGTNDVGNESGNYIDMGINSSIYAVPNNIGVANDAYFYSAANKLYIGNASTGSNANIYFFAGGFDSVANTHMFISSSGNIGIGTINPTTALQVNGNISASMFTGPVQGGSRIGWAVAGLFNMNIA